MSFRLPDLPYALDALAPHVSAQALEMHWSKHHGGCVDAVNRLVAGTELEHASLDDVIKRASGPLLNAAAQAENHAFLWRSMTPHRTQPSGGLAAAIEKTYRSRAALVAKWREASLRLFGSGWVWLVRKPDGLLDIVTTPNAGVRVHDDRLHTLLVCDVWEHAHYLDYKSDRGRYFDAFLELVDWRRASERYALAAPARRAGRGAAARLDAAA